MIFETGFSIGQAPTNLGVLEFADKSSPPKHYFLRDIYQDSDISILEKVKSAKAKSDLISAAKLKNKL